MVALSQHRDSQDDTKPYLALQRNAERTYVAQAGLLGEGLPNHRTLYEALPGPRELAAGADNIELRLVATTAKGDKVVEVLTFHRGSYVIDAAFDITNAGAAPLAPYAYFQLTRDMKQPVVPSWGAPSAFVGPAVYTEQDKYKKIEFTEVDKLAADPSRKLPYPKSADNGWVAMVEHYFVAAWVPSDEQKWPREFYAKKLDNGLYAAGVIVPVGTIAPGATGEVRVPLYVGPQDQESLARTAKGLDLVVDYGIFTVLAAPLFWLLKWLHGILGNWGWAIVVMTIMIKSAFYPLNHASARSMAKMKVIAPKMKALQEQYKNDKQQLQVKMMEMYKTEKINPLGGCLPILVQIPVFIALRFHCAVLGAAVRGRAPPCAVDLLDQGPVGAGSLLRAAGHLCSHRVPASQVVANADHRPGAGESNADHADRVFGAVPVLPVGPRAVLAHQQFVADLPAMAHEPRDRRRGHGRRGQAALTGNGVHSNGPAMSRPVSFPAGDTL